MSFSITIDQDPYIRKVLNSCVHESQIDSWIDWVDRIGLSSGIKLLYANMGRIKLEEFNKEMEELNEVI